MMAEQQQQPSSGEEDDQRQVEVRVDERQMVTNYTNGFRTHATAREVLVDFGLNLVSREPGGDGAEQAGQINFNVSDRIIMNYHTAKRLALTLGQLIRRYEEQFGELPAEETHREQP